MFGKKADRPVELIDKTCSDYAPGFFGVKIHGALKVAFCAGM
jgi:hypothetical protein